MKRNRQDLAGYKVVFIPFDNGPPLCKPQDFLTGLIKDDIRADVRWA